MTEEAVAAVGPPVTVGAVVYLDIFAPLPHKIARSGSDGVYGSILIGFQIIAHAPRLVYDKNYIQRLRCVLNGYVAGGVCLQHNLISVSILRDSLIHNKTVRRYGFGQNRRIRQGRCRRQPTRAVKGGGGICLRDGRRTGNITRSGKSLLLQLVAGISVCRSDRTDREEHRKCKQK